MSANEARHRFDLKSSYLMQSTCESDPNRLIDHSYRPYLQNDRIMCPICLRNQSRFPVETNCGHIFCAACIIQYWKHGDFLGGIPCPFCRQTVSVLLTCFRVDTNVRPSNHSSMLTTLSSLSTTSTSTSTSTVMNSNVPGRRSSFSSSSSLTLRTSDKSTNSANQIDAQPNLHSIPFDESLDEEVNLTQIIHDINDYNRRFSEDRPWLDYLRDLPILLRHLSLEFFAGGLVQFLRIRIVICLITGFLYLVSPIDVIPEAIYGIFGFLDDFLVILAFAVYLTVLYLGVLAGRWADEIN